MRIESSEPNELVAYNEVGIFVQSTDFIVYFKIDFVIRSIRRSKYSYLSSCWIV